MYYHIMKWIFKKRGMFVFAMHCYMIQQSYTLIKLMIQGLRGKTENWEKKLIKSLLLIKVCEKGVT